MRYRMPRALAVVLILAGGAALSPSAPIGVSGPAAGPIGRGEPAHLALNDTGRRVSVLALPDVAASTPDDRLALANVDMFGGSGGRDRASETEPAIVAPSSGPSARILTSFTGRVGATDPSDASVAVSTSFVVEATSESIRITDRSGNLAKETPLVGFLGGSAGPGSREVRVVYDTLHDRWLAAQRDADCVAGFVSVAASTSSDPTGDWTVWVFSRQGYNPDLPSIGISSDKVMVGLRWRGIVATAGGCDASGPAGSGGYVFDSSSLYAGTQSLPVYDIGLLSPVLAIRPATALSRGTDLHVLGVLSRPGAYGFGYARVAGSVRDRTATLTAFADLTGAAPNLPEWVGADGTGRLRTDWQPLQALWQNGTMWTAIPARCTPATEPSPRPCLRVVGFATAAAHTSVADLTIATAGADTYPGGIGLNALGTLFISWSELPDASALISTYASYRLSSDPANTLRPRITLATGAGSYPGKAWGRYSDLAVDPAATSAVWTAAPYSTGGGWGTSVYQIAQAEAPVPVGVVRYDGADRFASAARISANTFPAAAAFGSGVDAAYIAYAYNFPDALGAAAAAGRITGPVLLTASSGTLNASTRSELARLNPKKIIVVGGPVSVGADIFAQLVPLAPSVVRYGGADRFVAAQTISANTFPAAATPGAGVPVAYIACAVKFPDALAAAAAAGTIQGPVLLAATNGTLNAATVAELQRIKPAKIVVAGGEASVGADVYAQLATLAPSIVRYGGADRFVSAATVSANTFPAAAMKGTGVDALYVANAFNFPDALAGAAAAGTIKGPVLLVAASGTISPATLGELNRLNPKKIVILGGPVSVGPDVEAQLRAWAGS